MVTGPLAEPSLLMLATALKLWQVQYGYQFVDLPWVVPARFSDATRPADRRDLTTPHGSLVASGEQSFLQLWSAGLLDPSAPGHVGWTPCFRDEPALDRLHQFGFIKAEVFVALDECTGPAAALEELVTRQESVFATLAPLARHGAPRLIRERVSRDQVDLLVADIEVGSYGHRLFEGRRYLYGTALALPRFIQALEAADRAHPREEPATTMA